MKVEIRLYEEKDEVAVAALWREVFPESPSWNRPELDIQRKLAVQRELFLVATHNVTLLGTVMAGYDGHRGWIYYLAVDPKYRHKGIATALMTSVEERLARIGCPKINLQVRAGNEDVIAFYEKLGYRIEPRVSMGKLLIHSSIEDKQDFT
ncbi:MAG: GNAT family acetyltransferase [Anaerolineales bacterium]|jgi:hypothetical protein